MVCELLVKNGYIYTSDSSFSIRSDIVVGIEIMDGFDEDTEAVQVNLITERTVHELYEIEIESAKTLVMKPIKEPNLDDILKKLAE